MQSVQYVARHEVAALRDWSVVGRIFAQAETGPRRIVIRSVFLQDALEVRLVPANGTHPAIRIMLLRTARIVEDRISPPTATERMQRPA
jgi:hypothetical protein